MEPAFCTIVLCRGSGDRIARPLAFKAPAVMLLLLPMLIPAVALVLLDSVIVTEPLLALRVKFCPMFMPLVPLIVALVPGFIVTPTPVAVPIITPEPVALLAVNVIAPVVVVNVVAANPLPMVTPATPDMLMVVCAFSVLPVTETPPVAVVLFVLVIVIAPALELIVELLMVMAPETVLVAVEFSTMPLLALTLLPVNLIPAASFKVSILTTDEVPRVVATLSVIVTLPVVPVEVNA
jgi:hypothetical protein